jgi:hypothetical protein
MQSGREQTKHVRVRPEEAGASPTREFDTFGSGEGRPMRRTASVFLMGLRGR